MKGIVVIQVERTFKMEAEKVHSIRYACTTKDTFTDTIYFARSFLGDNPPDEIIVTVTPVVSPSAKKAS